MLTGLILSVVEEEKTKTIELYEEERKKKDEDRRALERETEAKLRAKHVMIPWPSFTRSMFRS